MVSELALMTTVLPQLTYLVYQIPPLHSQIRRNILVDGPCKFLVQFPGNEGERNGSNRNDDWHSNQKRSQVLPNWDLKVGSNWRLELVDDGVVNLKDLDDGINQKSNVVKA